jgi:hypothetical protein
MIPNHAQFIEARTEKRKVRVQFYSPADSSVVDRVCAPMDYGPGNGNKDGLNRYWVWDYASRTETHTLGLVPQQIVGLQVLGEVFSPVDFITTPASVATPPAGAAPPATAVSSGAATIPKL